MQHTVACGKVPPSQSAVRVPCKRTFAVFTDRQGQASRPMHFDEHSKQVNRRFLDFCKLDATVLACAVKHFSSQLRVPHSCVQRQLAFHCFREQIPLNNNAIQAGCDQSALFIAAVKRVGPNATLFFKPVEVFDWAILVSRDDEELGPRADLPNFNRVALTGHGKECFVCS